MKKILSIILALIISASLLSFVSVSAFSADGVKPAGSKAFNPVADYAGIFTDEQENEMREKIADINAKYGYELVIVTDETPSGYKSGTDSFYRYLKSYCEDYWFDNGLGTGVDQTGSMLFICMDNIYHGGWWTASFGDLRSVYTETMINAIDDRLEPDMRSGSYNTNAKGEYGTAVLNYLDSIDAVYAAGGKVPLKWKLAKLEFQYPIILAIIVGIVAGALTVGKQKRRMKTVEKASRAKGYLRDGSFRRNELGDVLIGVTVTKTAKSTSSSSGGRSSYSSSGRSSGGGRSF